ncbi:MULTISPECIES: HoxN/HupN/NixA family nickel/cobalt transporter [unclassified Acidiphilium]|uniref:HoxN/HupN/NixA family nickel/cobalt transporter n=1 Tax=unclassified Acidiphilium TaxID=2617493 RepID=UPI000BC69DAB|nr:MULTISPECIES: hydrolase [unclassified Acidiphilium]OYV55082.1 MAG: hydrolase [Acidiphilium sp. 20-67-58]HQT60231.1 hydrolase [Acidiphilium sp.]
MEAKGQKRLGATIPVQRILWGLGAANVVAWIWAAAAFGGAPRLLGIAGLAWLFGLRHAMDADHIAAIDNAVRRLAGRGRAASLAGLFFSLGHSSVVVLLAAAVSFGAGALRGHLDSVTRYGAWVGTIVSVGFLALIAGANLVALRAETRGAAAPGGVLSWLARPLFRLVRRSRDMYAIGFLFGLGFDTATEIGLLALSAAGTAHGIAAWRLMALPALFTAGMSLVDTADSALMTRAYGWALRDGRVRRRYNVTLTLVSAVTAVIIGGVELIGLMKSSFGYGLSRAAALLAAHWSELGMAIALMLAGLFLAAIRRGRAAARIAGRSPPGAPPG